MNQEFYDYIEQDCAESFLEGYNYAVELLEGKMTSKKDAGDSYRTNLANARKQLGDKASDDEVRALAIQWNKKQAELKNQGEANRRAGTSAPERAEAFQKQNNYKAGDPQALAQSKEAKKHLAEKKAATKVQKLREKANKRKKYANIQAANTLNQAAHDRKLTTAAKGVAIGAGAAAVAKMAHDAYLNHKRAKIEKDRDDRERKEYEAKKKRGFLFQEGYLAAFEDMDLE